MTFKNRLITNAAFMACLVLTLQPSVDAAPAPQQSAKNPMGISETSTLNDLPALNKCFQNAVEKFDPKLGSLYSQCFNAPLSPVADSADEEVSKTDKCLDSAIDDWVADKFPDAIQQQNYKKTQLENDVAPLVDLIAVCFSDLFIDGPSPTTP
ncbi:hypothetical protein BGZ88_007597 [Linnemannia elongata]|nr:hypothetical protein BGZ88_007597 [Linnemannia elongata]